MRHVLKLLPLQGATAPTRDTQGVASLALGYVLHWAFSPPLLNPKLEYVSLSVWCSKDERTDKWQLYFSTFDPMDGCEVLDYYRTIFQLEFSFRDSKRHAGITNCQSTDFRKLNFHFNASFAAVNLAKATCKKLEFIYSISSCKSFIRNAYMLE